MEEKCTEVFMGEKQFHTKYIQFGTLKQGVLKVYEQECVVINAYHF
jgi:hypothetical protein